MRDHDLPGLIGTIYDTALDPGRWTDVAAGFGRLFNAHRVPIANTTPDRTRPRSIATFGYEGDNHQGFLDTWHRGNIYARRPTTTAGTVLQANAIVSRAELMRSEIYLRYFGPREIQEALRFDILSDETSSLSMSVCRPWSAGAFDATELRMAAVLAPHLRRAATVGQKLGLAEALSHASLDALHAIGHAVLMLDVFGRIVHATEASEALLAQADGLTATPDGLQAATPSLTRRLTALLHRAAGLAGAPPTAGAMRLARPSGRPSLSLLAIPIAKDRSQDHGWIVPGRPTTLVTLTNPNQDMRPDTAQLMTLLGLTPSEARLASELLTGQSIAEIARATGRSLSTVRTHLARLMAKTDTSRQSELIRHLMAMPRLNLPN